MKNINCFLRVTILFLSVFLAMSCSKDKEVNYTIYGKLTGTMWRTDAGNQWEQSVQYTALKFTSASTVEGWSKERNSDQYNRDWIGDYTIQGSTISLYRGIGQRIISGSIEGNTMTLSLNDWEAPYVFTKQ